MAVVTIVSQEKIYTVEAPVGLQLSAVLSLHGAHIDFPCAGKGKCRQCRVRIIDSASGLSAVSAEEYKSLTPQELASGIRLACLTTITADVRVELPQKPLIEQIAGCGILPEFTLRPSYSGYAVAIDIGTTTLAATLCASDSPIPLKTAVMKNPQTAYGSDVISRIELSLAGKARELAACSINAINSLLTDLRRSGDFSRITIVGNTAMLYLLTEQNPASLASAPFILDRHFGETLTAESVNLYAPPQTPVYVPRCLASFVGADITAAILASRLCFQQKPAVLIDIGTNGEMALFKKARNQIFVCSTAAGPAFEGEGITMGMRGVTGAIDSVTLSGNSLVCGVIGSQTPVGMCGSGIIDAAAILKQTGIIDETGFIQEDGHDFEHLICAYRGETAVRLAKNVVITQKDIRNIQLAKSAICAGLETLIAQAELSHDDIETVFIAGGFGSYLNLQNAAIIGLIPPTLCAKTKVLGNAALSGAVLLTQNSDFAAETERYAKNVHVVDLAANKLFMDAYVQNMLF